MSRTGALAAGVIAGVVVLQAQPADRISRLEDWLSAIETHRSGFADEPLGIVRPWPRQELERLLIDLRSLVTLMQRPDASFGIVAEPVTGTARPYTRTELEKLRALARAAAARGDANRILKRGAMLHTEISMVRGTAAATTDERPSSLRQVTLLVGDGLQVGIEESVSHRAVARRLLDDVAPEPPRRDPARDDFVRHWYQAFGALLCVRGVYDLAHFERALELFPADAYLLMLAGSLHETLAGSRLQAVVDAARSRRDVSIRIGSGRDELERAEDVLRRAVRADPDGAEAHVRLGRVLSLRGRHAEALPELHRGRVMAKDPFVSYYAELALGGALHAVGSLADARAAFARAALLFPSAQSPRLSLSQLAHVDGDRLEALRLARSSLSIGGSTHDEDPWWVYDFAAGRDADARLSELRQRLDALDRR